MKSFMNNWQEEKLTNLVIFSILAIAVGLIFATAPAEGFWWNDAPRHAMDGVFYFDFFRDLPLQNPKEYAIQYYLQYPALTILFYPPFFPLVEAMFYWLFGVSEWTAQLTVAVFYFAGAVAAYLLALRWTSRSHALATSILFVSSHAIAFWGRQVMLDVPAFAMLLWSAWFLLHYLDTRRPSTLYFFSIVFCLSVYTKLNVVFMVPVFAGVVLHARGIAALKDKHVWLSALLIAVIMAPWIAVTLKFGHVNVGAVAGGQSPLEIPRSSIAGWTFYLKFIPVQLGWIVPGVAFLFIANLVFRVRDEMKKVDTVLLLAWFVWGYIFFSLIPLKEERHDIFILFPLIAFAMKFLAQELPRQLALACAWLLAVGTFAYTTMFDKVPYIAGVREAAHYVAQNAPPNSIVMFSGTRNGSFVFYTRAESNRTDLYVIRVDKLLVNMTVMKEIGFRERAVKAEQIVAMFREYGVAYIVNDVNFYNDIVVMKEFQRALAISGFAIERRIPVYGNVRSDEHELVIYRNPDPPAKGARNLVYDIGILGVTVEGKIGGQTKAK
jgi:4-amino-4-deoxy-L-arabinose transferase-like glycosyltransferase